MSADDAPARTRSRVPGAAGVGSNVTAVAVGFGTSVHPATIRDARRRIIRPADAALPRLFVSFLSELAAIRNAELSQVLRFRL